MKLSDDGFLRPYTTGPLSALEDQKIADICPGLGVQQPDSKQADPLWGKIVALRSGHATSSELRFKASSGGALSAILSHLIENGLAEYVVHTAANSTDPVGNQTSVSRDPSEVARSAGSRYAPSAPLDGIQHHLESDARFVFVGKPCDVAALRAMARQDPRINARVVCMISFFCAGIPSRFGVRKILTQMGVSPGFLRRFRYRGHGWPGNATAYLKDGSQRHMSYRSSWGDILSKHVQFRCKICPDGTGNSADIVCADAWYGDADGYPAFTEAKGRSLILSRTQIGEKIVSAAIGAKVLAADPHNASDLTRMQPGQVSRMRALAARLLALRVLAQPTPNFRGFQIWKIARTATITSLLRNFLGTGRRVVMGRR